MFFSKLSVLAAVAFGAFTSAIPLDTPLGDLPVPVDPSVVTGLLGDLPLSGLGGVVRRDTPKSLAVVLTGVQAQLAPVTASLALVTAANATVDAVTGPANEIVSILGGAVIDLKALIGLDADIILASVDGTVAVTVDVLAGLVAHVVVTVFYALGAVVTVAGSAIDGALFTLVAGILVGLDVAVLALIKAVVPTVIDLNVHVLVSLFKL
ncbi:hypothetical protein LXA43DRAFT_1181135 [Ganoderma leucocontextum]|nr:hypothetical protein LXA43DRAFT_1181135 [Ganoderma leucocontextum]